MDQAEARTTMLASETFKCRPPINSGPKMRNDDRTTDNQADGEAFEDLESIDALLGAPSEEPVDDKVPFIETLDAETRAQVDELLEASTMLARNVIAALYRR